jgi:hypothetical protein
VHNLSHWDRSSVLPLEQIAAGKELALDEALREDLHAYRSRSKPYSVSFRRTFQLMTVKRRPLTGRPKEKSWRGLKPSLPGSSFAVRSIGSELSSRMSRNRLAARSRRFAQIVSSSSRPLCPGAPLAAGWEASPFEAGAFVLEAV